jgi:hypothetical protein
MFDYLAWDIRDPLTTGIEISSNAPNDHADDAAT